MALTVSVVLPCLDEAAAVGGCVRSALAAMTAAGLAGEVVVVDNGSVDESAVEARDAGARVVAEPVRGYGAALLAGFAAAGGDVVVMADADGSYDLAEVPRFVAAVEAGADLVVGNRMHGIDPGAMPWLNRRVGNPALSGLLNALFRTGVRDAHCGLRAFRRTALETLDLQATGMELASEMVIRAGKAGLPITELAIHYRQRTGASKLSPWRDGWRHVRLLLLHAPLHLFVVPGAVLALLGALVMLAVVARVEVLGRDWHLHTLVGGSLLLLGGVQVMALGACAQAFAVYHLGMRSPTFERLRARLALRHGLLAGGALVLAGAVLGAVIVAQWADRGFAQLAEEQLAVVAATLVLIGLQVVFASLLLSVLGLRRRIGQGAAASIQSKARPSQSSSARPTGTRSG